MADPQGISFAPTSDTLGTADPTWERLDDYPNLVASWSVSRGRQDELAKTGTGTARIEVNDKDGVLDPTNAGGPYYGDLNPLKPVALCLFNPVLDSWHTIFRGYIEEFNSTVHQAQTVTATSIECVDMLELLGRIELVADGGITFGDPPPYGSEGDVFYSAASPVQLRIEQALDQAGIPFALYQVNTGNVSIQRALYPHGTPTLTVIDDACDAEFPGVANRFVNSQGIFRFTGRQVRFRPEVVDYDVDVWKAGDGTAILIDPDLAQIRGLEFTRGENAIINSVLSTPQEFNEQTAASHLDGQLAEDTGSIALYGKRSLELLDLLTESGSYTGNDKWAETKLFADYYIGNYADAQTRVSRIVFRSMHPDDPRAPWTWRVICEVEINDIIRLYVNHPGGGGFAAEDFFVEGITYDVGPLNAEYDNVTLTLDVTPRAHYLVNPFDSDPDPA